MSMRYKGGFIKPGFDPLAAGSGQFSGQWTMTQQMQALAAGTWTGLPQYELYAWGSGNAGRLGLGDAGIARSSPVQIGTPQTWGNVSLVNAASGRESTFAILENGTLWAWGLNNDGQLGLGTMIGNMSSPVQVGALTNWRDIGSGYANTVAIKTDGTMWSWGRGDNGFVGINNTNIDYSSPVQIGALTTWDKIRVGQNGAFAIKTDSTLWVWGAGHQGYLAKNSTINYSSPVQVGIGTWLDVIPGYLNAYGIDSSNRLYSWGRNSDGALGQNHVSPLYISSPVQVGALTDWESGAAGQNIGAFIKTDGTLWSVGGNLSGTLGDGTTINKSSPVQVGADTDWSSLGSFYRGFTAIKTDGTLWTWGSGGLGQLGHNAAITLSSPVQVGSDTNWVSTAKSSTDDNFAIKLTKT